MPINTYYMAKSAGVDPATGAQLYWVWGASDDGSVIGGVADFTTGTRLYLIHI